MYKNGFIRKRRLTLKFMKQTMVIYILPNISRSNDNQTIKFDQLIEHNMRKSFLEKSYIKCGRESIPRPFSEQSN